MVAFININHHLYHYQHQNGIMPMLGIVVLGLFIISEVVGCLAKGILVYFFFVCLFNSKSMLFIYFKYSSVYVSISNSSLSLPPPPPFPRIGLFSYSKNLCERSSWSWPHCSSESRPGILTWQAGLPRFSIFHSNCFFHSSVTWGWLLSPFLTYQSTIISRNKHWNICPR